MATYSNLILRTLLLATVLSEYLQADTGRRKSYHYRWTYPAHNKRQSRVYYWNPQRTSGRSSVYTHWYYPRNSRSVYANNYDGFQRDFPGHTRTQSPRQPRYPECGRYPRVRVNVNGQNCAELVTRRKAACYTYDTMSMDCCDACMPHKDERRPGCKYGDRSDDCRNLRANMCYNLFNGNLCCASCHALRRPDTPNCLYGDKADWCRSIQPGRCYLNDHVCCQTCRHYKRDNAPGCEYGDRMICDAVLGKRNLCYRQDVQYNCCASCPRVKIASSNPGCEYGDKIDLITTLDHGDLTCRQYVHRFGREACYSAQISEDCCHSCKPYIG